MSQKEVYSSCWSRAGESMDTVCVLCVCSDERFDDDVCDVCVFDGRLCSHEQDSDRDNNSWTLVPGTDRHPSRCRGGAVLCGPRTSGGAMTSHLKMTFAPRLTVTGMTATKTWTVGEKVSQQCTWYGTSTDRISVPERGRDPRSFTILRDLDRSSVSQRATSNKSNEEQQQQRQFIRFLTFSIQS